MKIQPLHDWAVVKRVPAEEKTSGGIIIPEMAKEKPADGVILSIGPGKLVPEKGKEKEKEKKKVFVPTVLKPGQRVIFVDYMAKDFEVDGVEITMIREEDVLGVYDEAAPGHLVVKKEHPVSVKQEHPVPAKKEHHPLVHTKPAAEKKEAKPAPVKKAAKPAAPAAKPAKKKPAAKKAAAKKPATKKAAKKSAPAKPVKKTVKPVVKKKAAKTAKPPKKSAAPKKAAAKKPVKKTAVKKKPAAAKKSRKR